MGLFLTLVGAVVIGVPVLVLLLLSVPWVIVVVAATDPLRRLRVELRPFSRGFPMRFRVDTSASKPARAGETPHRPTPRAHSRGGGRTKRAKRGRGRGRVLRMVRATPRLIRGVLAAFRIERLQVRGRIGLPDPADTGQLFGALLPLSFSFPGPRYAIDLQPDFGGATLDGNLEAQVRIAPIRAVLPALRFGWDVFVRRS